MIPEFIDFCKELFPSISPYTRDQAKRAMEQFEDLYGNPKLVAHPKDKEFNRFLYAPRRRPSKQR